MRRLIVLTGVLSLSLTSLATGAVKIKAGRYSGHLTKAATESVTFTVSGNQVTNVRVGTFVPNTCGGGGRPPKQTSAPVHISHGSFRATVKYTSQGPTPDTAIVTGTFLAGGRERGTVTPGPTTPTMCSAHFAYTTKHA